MQTQYATRPALFENLHSSDATYKPLVTHLDARDTNTAFSLDVHHVNYALSSSRMPKALNGNLDTFILNKSPRPDPLATSQEIRDRGSLFVANLYRATTPEEAKALVNHLKYYVHRDRKATHEISAWRMMVLKTGKTGFEGPEDFELVQGSKDDGESWAGGKVLKVMQNMAVIDAVVIVSRW